MSTLAMLEPQNRAAEAGNYIAWLADNGFEPSRDHLQEVTGIVNDRIYGHIAASNLEHFRSSHVEPELAAMAARILCQTLQASSNMVHQTYDFPDEQTRYHFWNKLEDVQIEMAAGNIAMIDEQFAMTTAHGLQQVRFADQALSLATPRERRLLSDSNYALYFSSNTMANGEAILETTIDEAINTDTQNQMPHLTRTNYAIGQYLRSFAQNHEGQLIVVDPGAGTGATTASIISGASEVSDFENVGMVAVESNASFASVLDPFVARMVKKIQQINPTFELVTSDTGPIVAEKGIFQLVHGDITEAIKRLNITAGKQTVGVMSPNYVFHRLTTAAKSELIMDFSKLFDNSILLIADLAANGSPINRRYFNWANNGPLNCGNEQLPELLVKLGYTVGQLGIDHFPNRMHGVLVDKIGEEASKDGYLWVAYKGAEAERLVQAA